MEKNMPAILVIVGITGDLAKRKLLPALARIASLGELPKHFKILGVTRQKGVGIDELLGTIPAQAYLREHTSLIQMDLEDVTAYKKLALELSNFEARTAAKAQRLFYLSVPPKVSRGIIGLLGESGLAEIPDTKLLLEKPFGVDLKSATEMVTYIGRHFMEDQVYRIDHYLAKEMSQNLIIFREENSLFRRTWNKDFIDRIEILASEDIGIEGRANFYEQTGALRDVVQSHLLQLAALTFMDTARHSLDDIPARRLAALASLSVSKDDKIVQSVKRGQYASYRTEVGNPSSMTETFVRLALQSSDARWTGVPLYITTGKKLSRKVTEIRMYYKKEQDTDADELVMQLYPHEGVGLELRSKRPGYDAQTEKRVLHFAYADRYSHVPEAYEQVLVDALRGDHTLFTSSAEVLESWRILAPIQKAWEKSDADLHIYKAGSHESDIS